MSNVGLFLKAEGSNTLRKACPHEIVPAEFKGYQPVMWSGKEDGLYIIFPDQNHLEHVQPSTVLHPQSLFSDREGNIWCGNLNEAEHGIGLQELIFQVSDFTYYPDLSKKEYHDLAVFSIYQEDNGDLLLGVKNYPFILRVKPDGRIEETTPIPLKFRESKYHPRAFLKNSSGKLWIGYLLHLLRIYDLKTKKFEDVQLSPQLHFTYPSYPSFRFLVQCSNGLIATGGFGCFFLIDPDSRTIVKYGLFSHEAYSAFSDHKGHLWFGGSGKLYRYDNMLNPLDSIKIIHTGFNIESICPDDSTHFWLGLQMGGLCRLDLKTHRTEFFTVKDGLANNTVYNILKDQSGKLWISTDAGISVFNPGTKKFFNYDESNGMYIQEFNADAALQCKDGKMLFGGIGGVVGFYPEKLEQENKAYSSKLIITRISSQINNRDTSEAVYNRDTVTFAAGTTNLQVSFSFLDFRNQEKTHFRYRLVGLGDSWEELQGRTRTINLMALKPGKFRLELQATDLDGNWSKNSALQIIIPPYFHETIWFPVLIGIAIVFITAVFIYMRIRQFRLEQKQRISHLRLITLQGQINPHFLSNSLAATDTFIASGNTDKANQYLGEVRNLMREMIDYTGKEYIPMEEEIGLLTRYLTAEQIRVEYLFDFDIIKEDIRIDNILIAPSMIQPFVENSIKHAFRDLERKKGMIRIIFKQESKAFLTCFIDDNGVGKRSLTGTFPAPKRKSKGDELIKERLDLYNKLNKTNLHFDTQNLFPGEKFPGTRVKIQIPCKFIS
jgi:hypothetical protein